SPRPPPAPPSTRPAAIRRPAQPRRTRRRFGSSPLATPVPPGSAHDARRGGRRRSEGRLPAPGSSQTARDRSWRLVRRAFGNVQPVTVGEVIGKCRELAHPRTHAERSGTTHPGALMALAAVLALDAADRRSEEHTSELQSRQYLVCR